MAFYLEKAIFINRAPFKHLEIDFKEKGINVLSAINGRGKTTILSHIVDALYELARSHYSNEFEGKENKYYRISTSMFNLVSNEPSFVYFRFIYDDNKVDYIDIRNKCSQKDYDNAINIVDKIPYNKFSNSFENQSNIKYWHIESNKENHFRSVFDNNIITYFPSYRYETPSYLSDSYNIKTDYKIDTRFSGYLKNPIEVVSGIRQIANWIMDVVLDWETYKQTQQVQFPDGVTRTVDNSPELTIWNNLNAVLRDTLSSKSIKGLVRIGIGKRNSAGTRISVVTDNNGEISTISPNLFSLSSGESAILCCFGEILRQADEIRSNILLNDIQGIVLIDEVDKHLHIKLQKEILPKLFQLFPNIQFIVSSHSPFLNMGLADEAVDRTQIIDLDNNGLVCEPTNNDLYKEVYEMMINENQRFYNQYINLQAEVAKMSTPIVITEGKTDIVHILKAKEKLGIATVFNTIQTENQPDGDSDLQKLLEQLSKVKQNNKIIAIFDRDIPKTVQKMDDNGVGYKSYGNNVFGFCISAPQSRIDKDQNEISIEYLYSDDEIHSPLPNGCKLFFGDEFCETSGRHKEDRDLILKNQNDRGKSKIVENNGGQAVYDINDNNVLAKKADFADAVKNDQISISQESWDNFKHIFEKLDTIISL